MKPITLILIAVIWFAIGTGIGRDYARAECAAALEDK